MQLTKPSRVFLDFDGGDGDQALFGQPFLAQVSSEIWVAKDGRERLSAEVLNGPCAGKTIHVESRVIETLGAQLAEQKLISVVVYRGDEASPVGTAAAELIRHNV